MRKAFLFWAMIFISSIAFSQAPQGISYQAIARTSAGQPIASSTIDVGFKIYDDNPNTVGLEVFHEIHFSLITNQFGLFTCAIGQGTLQTGSGAFNAIPWSNGHIWLEVGIDAGSGMTTIGSQQFMSVPYALYSNSSAGPTGATGATGPTGNNGSNGATGPTGIGTQGAIGPTGANGTNGTNGATGPTGANGTNGTNGVTGPTGANGTNGTNGATGPTGANGTNGATGPTGANGTNGTNGATGPTGGPGPSGSPGPTGPTGNANINGTINYVIKFISPTSGGNSIIFDNGTNVGIGNIGPAAKLDILSTNVFGGDLKVKNTTASGSGINLIGTNKQWMVYASNPTSSAGDQKLVFRDFSMGTDRMVIDALGNIGIGTTTPGTSMDLFVPDNNGIDITGTSGVKLRSSVSAGLAQFGTVTATPLNFFTSNANRMTIDAAGNVGVGTTLPNFPLNVTSLLQTGIQFDGNDPSWAGMYMNATSNLAYSFYGYKSANAITAYTYVDNAGNFHLYNGSATHLTVLSSGNTGINNGAPKNTLSVNGSVSVKKVTTGTNYTMTNTDYIVECSASITVTLPLSTTCDQGTLVVIRNRSGIAVSVQRQGSDNLNLSGSGSTVATASIGPYGSMLFYLSGLVWVQY